MLANNDDYLNALGRIKSEIAEAQNRAVQSANAEVIRLYWRVGRLIDERSLWGSKYLESLSQDIRTAFPGIKGFSVRSMKYMVKFAREVDGQLCSSCCTIPWGHIMFFSTKRIRALSASGTCKQPSKTGGVVRCCPIRLKPSCTNARLWLEK